MIAYNKKHDFLRSFKISEFSILIIHIVNGSNTKIWSITQRVSKGQMVPVLIKLIMCLIYLIKWLIKLIKWLIKLIKWLMKFIKWLVKLIQWFGLVFFINRVPNHAKPFLSTLGTILCQWMGTV